MNKFALKNMTVRRYVMIEMRLAKMNEAKMCFTFINDARKYQNQQGFIQWTENYPNIDTVIEDIQEERGYILSFNNLPLDIFALILLVNLLITISMEAGLALMITLLSIGWLLEKRGEEKEHQKQLFSL